MGFALGWDFPIHGAEALENGDPSVGLFKHGAQWGLGNESKCGRTERAGRTETEKFWNYNGRLEMSTRKHVKNSLGSMKGSVENEV